MAQRKRKIREEKSLIERVLIGEMSPAAKIMTAAGVLTAMLYVLGILQPLMQSGKPPYPSRTEITDLAQETDQKLDPVKKGLDATLEMAKNALVLSQQANQDARISRLNRLITQQVQLEAMVKMDPNNLTFQQLLKQTEEQISGLRQEISNVAQQNQSIQQMLGPTLKR